jgi:adenine-specific DNA-methyltransferase
MFLDPPYNTGKRFGTYDDNRANSDWQSMLIAVMNKARDMLTSDGVLWMTIGGNYTLDAWYLLDKIFGRNCLVADIPWRRNYKATNASAISRVHDTILVYSREPGWHRKRGVPPIATQVARYKNPDNDPKGNWRYTHAGRKHYLVDLQANGAMPVTWWDHTDVGHNEQAFKETKAIATTGKSFSYAKPEALLERIISISTEQGDLVGDLFAGSGTTLAVAHRLERRFLGVEQREENLEQYVKPRLAAQGCHLVSI